LKAHSTGEPAGITITEIVVVIGIVGLSLSVMVSGIVRSRGASRRVSCLNNLRQIALALHNYESEYQSLPSGVGNPDGPIHSRREGLHVSWVLSLLPFMEQWQLSSVIDQSISVYDPANTKVTTSIRSLLCPEDPAGGTAPRPWAAGMGSYAGCHHDVEAPIDVDNHGVFFLNSRIRHEDIPDGSSHTIVVGEKPLIVGDLGWASGTRATLRNMGARLNDPATFRPVPPEASNDDLFVGGFASYHHGGANFAFGDGSIRFIRETVDPGVYRLLGHRADGELISDDAFPNNLGAPTR
jgi:prepilin-type processing-associated H-X9-DG protein